MLWIDPEEALVGIDELLGELEPGFPLLDLFRVRKAKALIALKRFDEAEVILSSVWKNCLDLGVHESGAKRPLKHTGIDTCLAMIDLAEGQSDESKMKEWIAKRGTIVVPGRP